MKATFTKHFFFYCVMLFGFQILSAQNLFWQEDFSSTMGLPPGWTTEDASGGAGEWAWCNDPVNAATCIINWDNYSGQHEGTYFAGSAENGFLYMDSDALGSVVPDHIVNLTTTPIDCSGQPEVWVKFESLIGVFGLDATNNALLRVSTNGGTDWADFNIFELTTTERWSDNPEYSFIDISAVAAGQSAVTLQFSWTGNYEYYWLLDDLQLYDADPLALFIVAHDMRVNENFFAIANNALWPASQLECFGFLADIENLGSMDQTGVNLNMTIQEDGGPVAYTEDLFYGNIVIDSLAENQLFPGCFTPAATPGTAYTGTYTVTADSADLAPENNTQTFNFMVTDSIFSKEMGATNSVTPADSNWDDGEPHSWTNGNCYYVVNGEGYFARTISFGLANASDPDIASRLITLNLWEWETDTNNDGNCDPDERTKIAFNIYEIQGTETLTDVITLPLLTFPTLALEPIPLKDTTRYLAMIEYATNDEVNLYFAGSTAFDYGAQVFHSENLPTPAVRQAEMIGLGGDLEAEVFDNGAFASGIVPVVRLSIGEPLSVGTKDLLSDENILAISPNPASDNINLRLDLTEVHQQATIRIVDISGKVIFQRKYQDVQQENFSYDVSSFANGTYYLQFISDQGMKAEKFMVTK